jgi:hypothetical protein
LNNVPFKDSVRAKFVGASLLLLLIPLSGYVFVRELATYLRLGHEQVTVATAKLVAASLSDRPGLQLRRRPPLIAPPEPSAEVAPAPAADPEQALARVMCRIRRSNGFSTKGLRATHEFG